MAVKASAPMSSQRRRRARRRCHHCSCIESWCDGATAGQLPGTARAVALLQARSVYHELGRTQNAGARWARYHGPSFVDGGALACHGLGWPAAGGHGSCIPRTCWCRRPGRTPRAACGRRSEPPLRTTHGNRRSCARGGHDARRLEACATVVVAGRPPGAVHDAAARPGVSARGRGSGGSAGATCRRGCTTRPGPDTRPCRPASPRCAGAGCTWPRGRCARARRS